MIKAQIKVGGSGPEFFNAPWPIELVTSIPAVNYHTGPDRHFRRIAHVLVPNCAPSQLLDCAGSFEITNDLSGLVELAACMLITPTSAGTAGLEYMTSLSGSAEPANGKFITRFPGFNVTPNGGMHHAYFPLQGRYVVPEGMSGDLYVTIMAYCGGLKYWPTSETVAVEPYCGTLSVIRF